VNYAYSFTITKTATPTDPATKVCKLEHGIIHRVGIFWWPGPHGLVHLTINRALHQLLPRNASESYHYDNHTQDMEERIPLLVAPYQVELKGWAVGCSYDHEIIVSFGILPPECFPEYQGGESALDKVLKLFRIT
jgi:hypothetical protein